MTRANETRAAQMRRERSAANATHRDGGRVGLGAALPHLTFRLHQPRVVDCTNDVRFIPMARHVACSKAVVGGEARSKHAVGGDAKAIAALAIRVARPGDEADLLSAAI